MSKYEGILFAYTEQGAEGIIDWLLLPDGKEMKDKTSWVKLKVGDEITIYNPDQSVAYSGVVTPEFPTKCSTWHQVKTNIAFWSKFFLWSLHADENGDPLPKYRATLIKKN